MATKELVLSDIIMPFLQNKSLVFVKDMGLIIGLALLTALCSGLKIQIGLVPITLQTFSVLLAGILLGSKRGAISQIAYAVGGLAGVPWFSNGGGPQYIFSPTFGYILGFIFAAYAVGLLAERGWDRRVISAMAAMIIGNLLIYFFGLLWLSKFIHPQYLFSVGIVPFIAGDILKISVAGIILPYVWRFLKMSSGRETNQFRADVAKN